MSTLLEAKDGQLYTGYDSVAAIQFCTPSVFGCSACLAANVVDGYVALTISVATPFGNVTKTFKITSGGNFTWQPFGRFKVTVGINNFRSQGGFSFDAGIQVCIELPIFGWKCAGYSYHFNLPGHMLKAATELTDTELTNQLILQLLLDKETGKCNCH